MRPTATEALLPQGVNRPRKLSDTDLGDASLPPIAAPAPMLYFLTDQAAMQASTTSSSACSSNYGVRSLDASTELRQPEHVSSLATTSRLQDRQRHHTSIEDDEDDDEDEEDDGDEEEDGSLLLDDARSMTSFGTSTANPDFAIAASLPLTPMLGPSIAPSPMAPRSVVGGEEEAEEEGFGVAAPPQFIMPQIIMPRRRPFTERGRRMGKLKVLIAGDSGMWGWELGAYGAARGRV